MELAARMRYAQIVERPIPPVQVTALVEAARLLHERGEPWPALVGDVLQRVADELTEQPAADPAGVGPRGGGRTTRFLGGFGRDREPSGEA